MQVACLADGDARLALDAKSRWKLQTKPHGHGDVHALLHRCELDSLGTHQQTELQRLNQSHPQLSRGSRQ